MVQLRTTFLNNEDQKVPPTSKLTQASDPQFRTYCVDMVDDIDLEEPKLAGTSVASTSGDEDVETISVDDLSCCYEDVHLYSRRSSYESVYLSYRRISYEDVVTIRANCSDQSAAVGVTEQMKQQVCQLEYENKHVQDSNRLLLDAATDVPPRHADSLSLDCQGHRLAGGEEPARAGPQCFAMSFAGEVMRTMPMQGAPVADQDYKQNTTQPWMSASERERTTVMLRNLPKDYSSTMLAEMLHSHGFRGKYNFSYLPMDFLTGACLGYAFINIIKSADVPRFWQTFDGFSDWNFPSKKWSVTWSFPHQGLKANVERYVNSPVMHESVPQEFKPRLFANGKEIPFPLPTRVIRRPRLIRFGRT